MPNSIHPTAVISGDVTLGDNNVVGPYSVISGPARIGDNNFMGAFTVIGASPEIRSIDHLDPTPTHGVILGSENVIREAVQIHGGWHNTTTVGDRAFIMNQCYIAHDCCLGNDVTLASSVLLAGHVTVESGANLGMGTTVHQRRIVGSGAVVGMGSVVSRDIPLLAKAYGNPARIHGANVIGIERAGGSSDFIAEVDGIFRNNSWSSNDLAVIRQRWLQICSGVPERP